MGKTWCIRTGLNIATGIIVQLPLSQSIHSAVANIPECFIALLSTKNNDILGFNFSLRI
jgi:hypothetical protein